ncbi:hypothetical protein Snas_1136 [Stackebrandtia nassauensis DSM 44728]|uniref:Endo-alpha-N-acetylgalactosaminidase n=2 Tax=Stackebrandtia TaxID=283810 RepID=D3QB29_STANL|nr:hypothetical protein Snas_1136 [Stackebrandtia nassauensis DSM 44728]
MTALAGLSTVALTFPAAPAQAADAPTIASDTLTVEVDGDFPQVVSYTDKASGARLGGNDETLETVLLNGKEHKPTVTSEPAANGVDYTLEFPDAGGTVVTTRLSVEESVVTFAVTDIAEAAGFTLNTIAIPGHRLVTVTESDKDNQIAAARLEVDASKVDDKIYSVAADTPADEKPLGSNYTFAAANGLAAAIETNAVTDEPGKDKDSAENGRVLRQARSGDDGMEVGLWSGEWTYRGKGAGAGDTEPLPKTSIVITTDRNADDKTDWQDAGIAVRELMPTPVGAEETPYRVVPRIPFNIASLATHPFTKTLDDTKRIAQATDGLGQFVLLKGYGSEGHDAAHSDYGGNYNRRAGGLDDLNKLLSAGDEYNAEFGVHVNATESYPEANSFSDDFVDASKKGWAWMDQSYYINQRPDLTSGAIMDRFGQLDEETRGMLDFVYIDVYYSRGWLADSLSRRLNEQGLAVASEWSHRLPSNQIWSHWANDPDYGPDTSRGINSHILRFVGNHTKDVYVPHDLLGGSKMSDFEGWTGETDYPKFLNNIFEFNLPTKFLQRAPITNWGTESITLADGTKVSGSEESRTIATDYGTVYSDGAYLLPWPGQEDEAKAYHFNAKGGKSTFALDPAIADSGEVDVYELTDAGREKADSVKVVDGQVTIDAKKGVPYVVDAGDSAGFADAEYGEGTALSDPGFNSGDFDRNWDVTGKASVKRNDLGQYEAIVDGKDAASISQETRELEPGTYAASANVEVTDGASRTSGLSVEVDGQTESATIDRSTLVNTNNSDEKHGTKSQRLRTFFTVTEGSRAKLSLDAEAGDGEVVFDDVRIAEAERPVDDDGNVFWDFESVDAGWGPFLRGQDANASDANSHLSQKHAPYTQKGWNGKVIDDVIDGDWSMKAFEYKAQTAYRTSAATVEFKPGHKYRVSFDYESETADSYGWLLGADTAEGVKELEVTTMDKKTDPTAFVQEFTVGDEGDYFVGLKRLPGNDDQLEFVLDNFTVEDLGEA